MCLFWCNAWIPNIICVLSPYKATGVSCALGTDLYLNIRGVIQHLLNFGWKHMKGYQRNKIRIQWRLLICAKIFFTYYRYMHLQLSFNNNLQINTYIMRTHCVASTLFAYPIRTIRNENILRIIISPK